ncbi:MAG TPA: hypothetical protein DCR93_29755 [Cytophagales bacterium]|nr:hypothetical protein [Cytophagales bacterium]HAP63504.1 hypothetical protein [Cytophagales bacterium]
MNGISNLLDVKYLNISNLCILARQLAIHGHRSNTQNKTQMKVSTNLSSRAIALTLMMSLAAIGTSFASAEVNKKENASKSIVFPADPVLETTPALESVTAESLGIDSRYFYSVPSGGALVFDADDNLIAQGDLDEFGFPVTSELQEALRNATLMMTYEGVQYYRVD